MQAVYLDNAATSFPKPQPVLAAVERWCRELGVSAERGDGPATTEVRRIVRSVRDRLGRMCGITPERVAFTSGATESLNLFLRGFLDPGDRVLTTGIEHSSVVRPLSDLRTTRDLGLDVLAPDKAGRIQPEQVEEALAARPARLLCFSHGSNVTGAVLDASAMCAIAKKHGCRTLVDASQTAGLLPLDFGADAIAASAHKSLLAPPGLGFLAVREDVPVRTTKHGGTGSSVALATQPEEWPLAIEAGTPNSLALCGLAAALTWLDEQDPGSILAKELQLLDHLIAALAGHVERYGPEPTEPRLPVLSFTVAGLDPMEAAVMLSAAGIHARCGFHCAPWIHSYLGTDSGTIRVSPGPFSSAEDVLQVPSALGLS